MLSLYGYTRKVHDKPSPIISRCQALSTALKCICGIEIVVLLLAMPQVTWPSRGILSVALVTRPPTHFPPCSRLGTRHCPKPHLPLRFQYNTHPSLVQHAFHSDQIQAVLSPLSCSKIHRRLSANQNTAVLLIPPAALPPSNKSSCQSEEEKYVLPLKGTILMKPLNYITYAVRFCIMHTF